ncbi:hypothetical protein LEP1GSC194_4018 [Leptospira alstonii serovar Sichuan str. 79601]|uniref:Uncharacterized protein n=1 Tax=Leptospira alstonii serovar Sichuan str. 79601 TaxID=1218565 RepID=M6D2Z8_9LEPT|nr:hypothetical protein LEP1GSC194_4018 [Leptospira alstonii serovar Sichuan str. 79601]
MFHFFPAPLYRFFIFEPVNNKTLMNESQSIPEKIELRRVGFDTLVTLWPEMLGIDFTFYRFPKRAPLRFLQTLI